MGAFGRITKVSDLPSGKVIAGYIKKAMKLNEDGVKAPPNKAKPKVELKTPSYFMDALKKNKKAQAAFENFSSSHKREYIEWIVEAKTDETRQKRIETAVEWIAEGKSRNWKYMKK